MHALFRGHSEFITHSGRQLGGEPTKLLSHEQMAWPLLSLHLELGPHGDGEHGFWYV